MSKLTKPSRDLAERVLSEVGFEDRLIVYKLHRRAGPMQVTLYSFEEAVGFLFGAFPQPDFVELARWTEAVIKDPELADRIRELADKKASDMKKILALRQLMGTRLQQCRQIA
jgi:hypothetical protein